jgi:hypothetical protein
MLTRPPQLRELQGLAETLTSRRSRSADSAVCSDDAAAPVVETEARRATTPPSSLFRLNVCPLGRQIKRV